MNNAVYKHLLQTYGRSFAWWFGIFAETIRTLMLRIWVPIVMAQTVTALATGDIEAAKNYTLLFLAINIVGAIVGTVGELVAFNAENKLYAKGMRLFHSKITSKDMAFYRDNQTGYLTSFI